MIKSEVKSKSSSQSDILAAVFVRSEIRPQISLLHCFDFHCNRYTMSGMAAKHYQSIEVDTKSSRTIDGGLQIEGLK